MIPNKLIDDGPNAEKALETAAPLEMAGPGDAIAFERYAGLDHLINHYDAEGAGPLRKGEEPFRWSRVATEARLLLKQLPDFRVGIWLLRALLIQHGLTGLLEGLQELSRLLASPVESVYPMPEDGEHPREAHVIPLGWLGGEGFVALLRATVAHPSSKVTLGEISLGGAACEALTPEQRVDAVQELRQCRVQLESIRADVIESGGYWDRDPIVAIELTADLLRLLAPGGREIEDASINSPSTGAAGLAEGMHLQSRGDIKATFDRLLQYYRLHEPAHPAPILIERLIRMVDASFEEILKELYSEAGGLITRIKSPANGV